MGKKVLIIDDSSFQRLFLGKSIGDDPDLETFTAENGTVALEKLTKEQYDCVISDYEMPGMEPLDYFKKLTASCKSTPIIVLSGKVKDETRTSLMNLGIKEVFEKPFDLQVIINKIKEF